MRIVGFGADNKASSDYRCHSWLRALERRGHTVWRGELGRVDQLDEKVKGADIVIVARQNDAQFFAGLLAGRDIYGYRIVVDTDDYTDGLPGLHPNSPAWSNATLLKKVARGQYRNADHLTASTTFLAETYKDVNPRISVIPNCVDVPRYANLNRVEKEARHKDDVRVYWAGGVSHLGDMEVLRPAYTRLLKERPQVKFVFSGFIPSWAGEFPWDRVFYTKFCDYADYPQHAAWVCADIGVAPLADHPFNRAKSHVKWLEYGMNGIAGVYQGMQPYATVNHGKTGLLALSPDDWYESILRLVDDRDLRAGIAANAYADIMENWTVEAHADRYEALLQEVAARKPLQFMPLKEGVPCQVQMS